MSKLKGKFLAIDLDPEGLIAVSGTASAMEHAYAWIPGQEQGPPPLTAENAKQLGAELRKRLDAAGFPAAPLLVGIGRDKTILKEVRYPGAIPSEETRLVHGQAQRELGDLKSVFDYAPLPDAGEAGEKRALVVAVKSEFFEAIKAFAEGGKWTLAAVAPRPYAIAAGLSASLLSGKVQTPANPEAAMAVVSLGPQGGEFTVIHRGSVTFTRAVPPQAVENEQILLNEIRRNLTTYDSQNASRPVGAVYVPEAEHTLGGWSGKLEDGLAIPVHAYDPIGTAAEKVPVKLHGRYAGAAGLLAGHAIGLPVNLASPRRAVAKTDPRKPIFIATAIAASVLVIGGGIFGYMAVDAADTRLVQKRKDKEDLEKFLADAEPDGKRIAAAEQWQKRGVNYLDELFDMADRMPPNDTVRVNKITGAAIRVDKNGKQNGQAQLVISVGAKNPVAASELVSAIDRDNLKDRKFYTGTSKIVGGADTHANTHNQLATITTTVNHRAPSEYIRDPKFTPPRRGAIAPPPPVEEDKKPADPDDLP
jgi:hypothetical protein